MLVYILLFVLGLSVGSFLNVLIYRETEGEEDFEDQEEKGFKRLYPNWAKGRSYCDHCKHHLHWYDNIPLLSYLFLRGRCRYCAKKISIQYPLVEFLTGIEFVWVYFLLEQNLGFFSQFEGFYSFISLLIWLFLGAFLLAIFVADIRYQIVPDGAVFGGILIALFKIFVDYRYTGMIDWSVFPSAFSAALFFYLLIVITQGKGMGFGDVKLIFLIGLVVGFPEIVIGLFFAFLTGAIVGVILIFNGGKDLKSKIAFGPFLIIGMIAGLIWGEQIWQLLYGL
jgi:prepilin signal peptidase PulO-like enzyme (type II secretory pathway)